MKICSPQLGLSPKSVLGGEVFDREILLGLAGKGIKVEIILPKGKPHDKNVKNWRVTYLPIAHFPAFLGNFLYLSSLFRIYSKNKFDVLRLHQPQFLAINAIFFKIFHLEVKVIATYHQFRETKFGPFSKKINNHWDHIICDSDNVKQQIIEKYGVNITKITVVHNGVPMYLKPAPKDSQLEKKLRLEDKVVLLFMGLFTNRKNPLFMLDVLKNISKTHKNVVILFWGKGPLKNNILQRAKEKNLMSSIRFIKPIYGPEKNKIHNLADIFVHPSLDEGFALAPLESMSCAKPLVMANGYSSKEAVTDGVNGYLCQGNNLKDWTEKLIALIKSPQLAHRMGRFSLKKARKEFSWRLAIKKHVNVIKSLKLNDN